MSNIAPSWLDEVDLDPQSTWLRMGTRNLGERPWLVADDRADVELALKAHLLASRHEDVFAAAPDAYKASEEVLSLVLAELSDENLLPINGAGLHPLDHAGRLIQEDLCLLRPADGQWVLAAASLCFPSRWQLADKFEQKLDVVHGPVDGYEQTLDARVDNMLNRLDQAIVWRRNWFIHSDPRLFQPIRPPGSENTIPADRCLSELFLRSERQTLRRLEGSGWVLFTIRTQQMSLRTLAASDVHFRRLRDFLGGADEALAEHKGMSVEQVAAVEDALSWRSLGLTDI